MRVFCSWYLRRRAQRGQPFFTTAWQLWWKTVLHSPHLEESGKCGLRQWAGDLPGARGQPVFLPRAHSQAVLYPQPQACRRYFSLPGQKILAAVYPKSRNACWYYFIFYKFC